MATILGVIIGAIISYFIITWLASALVFLACPRMSWDRAKYYGPVILEFIAKTFLVLAVIYFIGLIAEGS